MCDMSEFVVTRASHPKCFEAFEIISHDRGSGAGHEEYCVVAKWSDQLEETERALATLTPEELETFAIGEFEEVKQIAERSSDLQVAHLLLDAFFDDFED